MQKFFITSTGTGIGKTLVTTSLCYQLSKAGKKVVALKPIISGYTQGDMESDSALILQSLGLEVNNGNVEKISPWRFAAPLSPNMAAELEGKEIKLDDVVKFCRNQEKQDADILIVEGVGGVCVPLNHEHTVLDWIQALADWKIIVIAGSYLGSISHSLTALQALSSRGLEVHSVIVSESENSTVAMSDTVKTLANFLQKSVSIVPVYRQNESGNRKKWEAMPSITGVCL